LEWAWKQKFSRWVLSWKLFFWKFYLFICFSKKIKINKCLNQSSLIQPKWRSNILV
jgi:hypothetical protein